MPERNGRAGGEQIRESMKCADLEFEAVTESTVAVKEFNARLAAKKLLGHGLR
jgi:hypothetical protein